jgi:hypothetical protein
MKRKKWIWLMVGVLLVGVVIAAAVEPKHRVLGLLRGEAFYQGRPTSYWREVLRADGEAGDVRNETITRFAGPSGSKVLVECLKDPDPNVRWPAASLLGRRGNVLVVVPALGEALHDPDREVRLQAIQTLAEWGTNAQAALADLVALHNDPDTQVRQLTDTALWEIDVDAALVAGGWKEFRSPEWDFSAVFPGCPDWRCTAQSPELPEENNIPVGDAFGPISGRLFMGTHGASKCAVYVGEYADNLMKALSEGQRTANLRELTIESLGGQFLSEVPIEKNGLRGHEQVFQVNDTLLRTRLFWADRRLYRVTVGSDRKFLNQKAADYFLDSFRLR